MNMEITAAADYLAALGFDKSANFLEDFILNESSANADTSGIYVILRFNTSNDLEAAKIESEREKEINKLELKRFNLLNQLQGLNSATRDKIKELQDKADANPKKSWLYLNNIDKIKNTLESKKDILRDKLEKNRVRIEKKESFYHKKLDKIELKNEVGTEIFRHRSQKDTMIKSFFEKI